jgi:signal transduction histidine kinase
MRHAQAKNVWIELDCTNGQLELTVRDDGQGFDVTQTLLETRGHSLGLAGLRERVALAQGQLTISSMVGQGTTIYAFFPADDFTGAD